VPSLLDLYSGGGGAAVGWHRAGFTVTGVDKEPQPDYPFTFIRGDAVSYLLAHGHSYDLIHASPPCQRWATQTRDPDRHPDWIAPTRAALVEVGVPYVIENVVTAPLVRPVRLCGSAFGLSVRRHRLFESSLPLVGVACAHARQGRVLGVYGDHSETATYHRPASRGSGYSRGTRAPSIGAAAAALGCDWIHTWATLTEAIPPVYTFYLGKQARRILAQQGA
jgi:DNA (cytosine-5)-methyltransferase 1